MSKKPITLAGLTIFGFLLVLTNPPTDSYLNWASERICKGSDSFTDITKKTFCFTNKNSIDTAIRITTNRRNYLLFSLYATKVPLVNNEYHTIAILGNFILIK